jgi:hypothetical protein
VVVVVLTVVHLVNELQRHEHSALFGGVVGAGILVFLLALALAYRRSVVAAVAVGVLAFAELALQISTHFAVGPTDLSTLAPTQGIGFTIVLVFLGTACLMTLVVAIVYTTNPDGQARRLRSLPLLGVSLAGAVLLLLHAADDVPRKGFGGLSVEDGTLIAVVTAAVWVVGAMWMASALRRGAILVAGATLNVWWPFYTLHLAPSGVSLDAIRHQSGLIFVLVAAAAAISAAYGFVVAVLWLGLASIPWRVRALRIVRA